MNKQASAGKRKVDWNEQAPTYDQFVFCELDDTRAYLDAAGLSGAESVLDVCCGPGRISVLAAERGCSVVGIDSAEKMLACARENAQKFGVANKCDFRLLNWECVLPGQNLEPADVVIASRCQAMMDVQKLSALARQKVVVQIFANAPSIPALKNILFDGCEQEPTTHVQGGGAARAGQSVQGSGVGAAADAAAAAGADAAGADAADAVGADAAGADAAPIAAAPSALAAFSASSSAKEPHGGAHPMKHLWPTEPGHRAGSAYLDVILRAYDAGYSPNVRIMPERFRKAFESNEAALEWICQLSPERAAGHQDRVALNVKPFLHATGQGQGVEFCIATTAAIIWWETASPFLH